MDLTECSLCNEQYNGSTRRARSLPCAHYFCNQCLSQVIKSSSPRCPSCRSDIAARSAETLPPNFLMDELISKMKSGFQSMSNEGADDDFSAGDCTKHRRCQLYFTCRSHKMKVCRDCTVIDHNPSRCEIISFEDEMKETKESTIRSLKSEKTAREENIKELQEIITHGEEEMKQHQEEIDRLQKMLTGNKQIVEKATAKLLSCKENNSKIESAQQALVSSNRINQIKQSCNTAENTIEASKSLGISLETCIKDCMKQNSVLLVKRVLESNATVHVTAEVNGQNRYAKLMEEDGHLVLPALASCNSPPRPNKTVTVSSLLSRYNNTDIYLTLATGGKQLGTVYVKLRDNASAKYIRKLCMGTIGPCYRGNKIDGKNTNYYISVDDISKYDSSRCIEPPPTLINEVRLKKGTVYTDGKTRLAFFLNNMNISNRAIGDVINGMSVVEEAHEYPNGQVSIDDVGIVLE